MPFVIIQEQVNAGKLTVCNQRIPMPKAIETTMAWLFGYAWARQGHVYVLTQFTPSNQTCDAKQEVVN